MSMTNVRCKTFETAGVYLGDRQDKFARKLWTYLPPVVVAYTDFW